MIGVLNNLCVYTELFVQLQTLPWRDSTTPAGCLLL